MTFRFPSIRSASSATSLTIALALAGCAGRSLNVTPVEDWSDARGTAATPALPTPAPAPQQLYTVKRGDTLTSIATRYNTTAANVAAWNQLSLTSRLMPEQVLRVSQPAPPPAPTDNVPTATTSPVGSESVEQRPLGVPSGPSASSSASSSSAAASNAPLKTGPSGTKRPYSDAAFAEMSKPDGGEVSAAPAAPATAATPASIPSATLDAVPPVALVWTWPAGGKPLQAFGDGKSKGIDIAGKPGDPVLAVADGKVTFAGTGVRGYGNFVIVRHSPELLSVYAHNRVNLVKEGAVVTRGQKIAEMGNTDADSVKLHFEIRSDSKPVDPLKFLPER